MGKITKQMQPKHAETLSLWLKDFVTSACSTPLPLLPDHLSKFPTRWPFPRGDLYHWIPLLNRFDTILDCFCTIYNLEQGPQNRDFGRDLLLNQGPKTDSYGDQTWDNDGLAKLGYDADGDKQLIEAVLKFTRTLLEHCGNRSIYSSSMVLNKLLNTTVLSVLLATLQVSAELAQRYQASVKRIGSASRTVSTALLGNHYQIDLDRVNSLALPFAKTPIVSLSESVATATPTSSVKGKEKGLASSHKNAAIMFANDLGAVLTPDKGRWNGWGDIKITYTVVSAAKDHPVSMASDRVGSNMPSTPTPLRRSTTAGSQHNTPRSARQAGVDETSPLSTRSPLVSNDQANPSQRIFDLPQSVVASTSIYELLARCPADMPASAKYEVLNRLRVAKALLDGAESRQQALAVRLLAITNLAYIHPETTFVDKVLRHDNDETRRYQLAYQLAELIHPPADGSIQVPLWLQSIVLALLEVISNYAARYQDVLSALNANVNHGILLYVIRKAVAGMKTSEPDRGIHTTEVDQWRTRLFSLTTHLAMSTRIGAEMVTAGLMDILVEILKIRSDVAQRNQSMILAFLDGLIWTYQNAFQSFFSGSGLDAISDLLVTTVVDSKQLVETGQGNRPEHYCQVVDYQIPYNQQQTLKWVLKFVHHMMTNSYTYGGNTDRLLRNLVDKSELLGSLREIMQNTKRYGSVLWTNTVTVLSDFINNDPTSFAAISESGIIVTYLEAITGHPVTSQPTIPPPQYAEEQTTHTVDRGQNNGENSRDGDNRDRDDDDESSPDPSDASIQIEADTRPHPPPEEEIGSSHDRRPLAQGILATSDAINVVPQVLNSICLNNAGMKMVASSRALESFLEIFESPAHVNTMETDPHLASNVGASFDELARHHPNLRRPISNAVIDMVARVRSFGIYKAKTAGWGAKLLLSDGSQNPPSADERYKDQVLHPSANSATEVKAKERSDNADVEMSDATEASAQKGAPGIEESSSSATAYDEITPYVYALSSFLSAYFNNNTLKAYFINHGGIELLLDVAELPSLPHDFCDSHASRTLHLVISQLVEQSPVLGLPSLLKRAQASVDALKPLAEYKADAPYFAPFLAPDGRMTLDEVRSLTASAQERIFNGNKMVKALLTAQSLIKTLYECFTSSPRSNSVQLYPINVFDYYINLVKSLGPLLKAVLAEEGAEHNVLPQHWWAKRPAPGSDVMVSFGGAAGNQTIGESENEIVPALAEPSDAASGAVPAAASGTHHKAPTKQEQATSRYRNYETLRILLHSMVPSTFPFFQQLGKALFPRRERDAYSRPKHVDIAKELSGTILAQLAPSVDLAEPTAKEYHYWIIMLHTLTEMLMDNTRASGERPSVQVVVPVLAAFMEQGGFKVLTTMVQRFSAEICKDTGDSDAGATASARVASFGLGKIFEFFAALVNGKNISDSTAQFGLLPRSTERRPDTPISHQIVVEVRMAVLPVIRETWESTLIEKLRPEAVAKVIEILKIISAGDQEPSRNTPAVELFKKSKVLFNWQSQNPLLGQLEEDGADVELAREAVFRANGNQPSATEYSRLHKAGKAGQRNPVPSEDAYNPDRPEPINAPSQPESTVPVPAAPVDADAMAVDVVPEFASPELDRLLGDAVLGDLGDRASVAWNGNSDVRPTVADEVQVRTNTTTPAAVTEEQARASAETQATSKEILDEERSKLRDNLIDRSLDVVRAHPHSAIELSELISAMVFRQPNDEAREEVGATLANALTSLSFDDSDSKPNGTSIAAYAHLLALLMQEKSFFKCNIDILREKVDEYISFLKLKGSSTSNEELPPWIPYILLIVELLLSYDEQPLEAQWKPPTNDNETAVPAVLPQRNRIVSDEERDKLLDAILNLLPVLGKEETLATSVLRVIVILTRKPAIAQKVGERKNLGKLFAMVRQLAGVGAARLKESKTTGSIMSILRHIVEDEETLKQIMRAEVRSLFDNPQRTQRNLDLSTYLRNMAPLALRSPDLFVEITNEMTKLSRWTPGSEGSSRAQQLALKEPESESQTKASDEEASVEPAVQATEDLSIHDVKRSTETDDKEMADAPKPVIELKRPVVENPHGIIHFLLCELLNYREVDDNEPLQVTKDTKSTVPSGSTPTESASKEATPDNQDATDSKDKDKDKKSTKPVFRAEEHPHFIYRCFLLNCLAELLQSYNQTKVEFINFKRGASMQTNTPVKRRPNVLNYLIHDLLCQGNLSDNGDSILSKKKAATSAQAQQVLVALVAKTGERVIDKSRDRFEYDDEPDLLFVRKFVLDTILKAYERAVTPEEPVDTRYLKMQCLAELMNHVIGEKDKETTSQRALDSPQGRSQAQLRRMMYEKGYLDKLTSSIAEVDLSHAGVKRAIKYVLRVLRVLTDTAKELSRSHVLPSTSLPENAEDDIISTSSMSDMDDDREETPDLYRNSTLGMLEPRGSDDESDDEDEDDDEEMYDDDYGDELDYGDEDVSDDGEDGVSDEDEELGEMGHIEGLHGDPGVVEVIMGDEDDDMDEDDDESEDDDMDSDDMEEMDEHIDVVEEIVDEDGNPLEDDGASDWESESEEEDDEDEEDIDYEAEAQDLEEAHMHGMESGDIIDNLARAVMDPEDYEGDDMDDLGDHYIDDGRDEEDDEDDDEDMEEDELIYDEDYPHDHPPPTLPSALGWDTLVVEPFGGQPQHAHRHRHGHRSPFPPGFMVGGGRDPLGDFRSYFSPRHRPNAVPSNADDGVNPLLRRNGQGREASPRPASGSGMIGLRLPPEIFGPGAQHLSNSPIAILNDLVASLPVMRHGQSAVHLSITQNGRGEVREYHVAPRESRADNRRETTYHEPQQAVAFTPESTFERYQEEARMVFGGAHFIEKAQKLINILLSKLVPPAMEFEKKLKAEEEERRKVREEERKKFEEETRRIKEAKEAEEKAAREKKEAEEREEHERAAAEAAAAAGERNMVSAQGNHPDVTGSQAMEGVETQESSVPSADNDAADDASRVMTTIRGEEVDVTELGIDPDYLAALPEEFREEVIAQTVSTRRSQAREEAATGEQGEVFQEFLDALPEDLRLEIVQQERQDARRRERDEQRRQATTAGQDQIAVDMDPASILLTFPPELRQQVLMDQGEDIMDHLPPEMAAQARLLAQQHSAHPAVTGRSPPVVARRPGAPPAESGENNENKVQRRTVVQMLDKPGVATLLRLMFISQIGSIRNYLFSVLADVCENRQNRLEVISTILLILQEGSTDMDAVERSFSQLSVKAKKPKDKDVDPKTPQNLKRTLTSLSTTVQQQSNSEISPLMVVHQCLDLLQDLSTKNPHIPMLFLTEHEAVGSSLKRTLSRKGKAKDSKAHKYAINSLLTLLDRDLVMESSVVMAYLADLLNKITVPLATMERRRREALDKAAREAKKKTAESAAEAEEASTTAAQPASNPAAEDTTVDTGANVEVKEPRGDSAETRGQSENSKANDKSSTNQKTPRQMQVPIIPPHNLTLVVKIFVARECSSKTFQNTISAIKNLSAIPGAKATFGQELVRQARVLSENIVADLDELLPHIEKATSGTEIQGVALAKFSPGASEQNKLLRVLTALDHLFDNKKKNDKADEDAETSINEKQDLVTSLYHNSTFSMMWEKLSACLSAIRERENMVNVATILLPLIESLMVVCKNTAMNDDSQTQNQTSKEMLLSSPPPENRMAGLFFTFTEEHRRILNELVRNSPKLMSGTFSLLVKNPKVLEFDNKRNYFNRSVHSRSSNNQRPSFPALQLSVRREHVFHDSFKSLYFKTGDEMKYGKLNIRFHNEEGVDAGGVTREWFQVLSRQMFDANYALFIPVSSDRTTFHPNKLSGINDEHLMFFKFIGRIIGKALYEGRVLDCYFSRAVYKRILGKSVSVKDMESFDPDYYKSLVWMLDNDITDIITETFSVEDDEFGVTRTVDLCTGGRDIAVTEENKHDYVRLVVEHKLLSSVKEQMEHFLKGFHDIIPADLISIFNEQELELLISGLPDIDVDDWKSNTEYHNYTPSSPQIQWFWRAIRSFDKEERAKLLQFVTGTSKVPLNGFKELEGMNGINRFNIHRDYGNKERLPSSHTCFNQLDLPEYENYEMLRQQLMKAITAGSDYFGFA
ncbi:HECT-domain-containing protein [Colletotrichum orchidophilum]|uniref:HECT-type E3 ubiquitin transferase n=1 Tax=Colletotrichum orchidophilum TaxID=1209926 RepID=A0A1G4B6X2_9PEZI|nr:HECT-domain-containing protein [Colletotrichum orchidophilum]OHE97086.1 HECT-domain-containing protein [Colletotrichum orchidophilum]